MIKTKEFGVIISLKFSLLLSLILYFLSILFPPKNMNLHFARQKKVTKASTRRHTLYKVSHVSQCAQMRKELRSYQTLSIFDTSWKAFRAIYISFTGPYRLILSSKNMIKNVTCDWYYLVTEKQSLARNATWIQRSDSSSRLLGNFLYLDPCTGIPWSAELMEFEIETSYQFFEVQTFCEELSFSSIFLRLKMLQSGFRWGKKWASALSS